MQLVLLAVYVVLVRFYDERDGRAKLLFCKTWK